MNNGYMNKKYLDDLKKLPPEEIVKVISMEMMAEPFLDPAKDILNILTYSGISFNDFRNYLCVHLPPTNQAGKPALEVLLRFFKELEKHSGFSNENLKFIKNPEDYEKL